MPVEVPVSAVADNWPGKVRAVTIGAVQADGGTRQTVVTVGGQKGMPFLDVSGARPIVAVEIKDQFPVDWSPVLHKAWGDVLNSPAAWAKAAEDAGAEMLVLALSAIMPDGNPTTPQAAVASVKSVLSVSGLPLAVFGPGQVDLDNALIVAIAEATKGERLLLGICEDKNYRTIVATAMANGHLVTARTPMDVNLAKQLNILISDMGFPLDRVIMDPTTGALGYGIEYGYSAMERLRLAALQGDAMTQLPMLVTPGFEAWKTKEAKVGEGVPAVWGDWERRGVNWEVMTAVTLLHASADILVLRHPSSVAQVKAAIAELVA